MAYNPINLGPTTTANSQAVVLPSDQVAIPVIQTASATGGVMPVTGSSIGGPTSILITNPNAPVQVYGWYFYNPNVIPAYVSFYNESSGINVGSTPALYVLAIPPVAGANVFGVGIMHSNAISIAIAQGRAISTAMSTAVDYNIFYKS
jgi:hypothetical protein